MPVQLALEDARRPRGRGGWRPGAGRKRRPGACSHRARVRFPASAPLHVTLKVIGGLPCFRREAVARVVRAAIAAGGHRGFRVVRYGFDAGSGSDADARSGSTPSPAGDGRGQAKGVRNADVLGCSRPGAIVVPALTERGGVIIVPKS